jgi:lysozyme family protein
MQSSFQRALAFTLTWEGGWANHPKDPGGATMRGVTQRVYNGYRLRHGMKIQTVRNIAQRELEEIYLLQYWNASGANGLEWPLSAAVFDLAVNSGPGRAKEFLAEIGPQGSPLERAVRLNVRREQFFHGIVAYNHDFAEFLTGWLNRLAGIRKLVSENVLRPVPPALVQPVKLEGVKFLILNGTTYVFDTLTVMGAKLYANGVSRMKGPQ